MTKRLAKFLLRAMKFYAATYQFDSVSGSFNWQPEEEEDYEDARKLCEDYIKFCEDNQRWREHMETMRCNK